MMSLMAYTANLSANQQLYLENQGTQTLITLISSSAGQQQSQSSNLTTGTWTTPPMLFTTKSGFVLQLDTNREKYFVQIQASSINTLTDVPSLNDAETVALQKTADSQHSSKIEFEPMQPMKMGNMSMNMNPMEMRMGNMSMKMGEEVQSTSTQRFCTQCGHQVKDSDRFCGSCGHQLKD
jgi:hypothetical protein